MMSPLAAPALPAEIDASPVPSDGSLAAGLSALEALADQLGGVNALLESSFGELSNQFVGMAEDMQAYRAQTGKLLEDAGVGEAEREAVEQRAERISATLAQSIVSMQFQDRVSQNLVITVEVLEKTAGILADCLAEQDAVSLDITTAQEMLSLLKLGEIREQYVASLQQNGFLDDPATLGVTPHTEAHSSDAEDVELF